MNTIPTEIWAIRHPAGHLVPPLDDDGCECFMAFPTKGDAEIALQQQIDKDYIAFGEVVQVK